MRDWWKILILLLLIVFVLYRGCGLRKVFEGMEPNTEMITNGNFMLPLVPTTLPVSPLSAPPAAGATKPTVVPTSMNPENVPTTQTNRSITILPETTSKTPGGDGTVALPYQIGWTHAMDISLCVGASNGIKAPAIATKQYILIDKPNVAIEQSVAISDKGIYDITINAAGTNPISVYLKTGTANDASQNIYSFTPTADWIDYTKRFVVSAANASETIAIMGTGTGLTGISSVSLKMPAIADPNDDVKKAIMDVSNNVIQKMTEMTTHEDTKFAEMLTAINNMKISAIDNNVNKYSGY
jgi:hypothetical protein